MIDKKDVVLLLISCLVMILLAGRGPFSFTTITGNVVAEPGTSSEEMVLETAPAPTQTKTTKAMADNIEAIKTIMEEEQKQNTFCQNECNPEGRICDTAVLSECSDFDYDGCLEFRKSTCINGCDGNKCREIPVPAKVSQGELVKTQGTILTDETCNGKLIGTIQWNPDGSLCRRSEFAETSGGLVKPLGCCSKFYYNAACTQNLGMLKRGPSAYSQFFLVGCYET